MIRSFAILHSTIDDDQISCFSMSGAHAHWVGSLDIPSHATKGKKCDKGDVQMTPNYSYLFPRPLFPSQSRSFSLWSTKSLNGCHPTSFVSTLPKLNSS